MYNRYNPKIDSPENMTVSSVLALPLRGPRGANLGVLVLYNKQDTLEDTQQVEGFSEDDLRLADAMGQVFAQAMRCYSLNEMGSQLLARANSYREILSVLQGRKSYDPLPYQVIIVIVIISL